MISVARQPARQLKLRATICEVGPVPTAVARVHEGGLVGLRHYLFPDTIIHDSPLRANAATTVSTSCSVRLLWKGRAMVRCATDSVTGSVPERSPKRSRM